MSHMPQAVGTLDPFARLEEGIRGISASIMSAVFIDELRRQERVNRQIPVYFRLPASNGEWTLSSTVNISRAGICIVTGQPLAEGEAVEVEIGRKLMDTREVFRMNGKVVAVSAGRDKNARAHIVFLHKQVVFHRVNNVLWGLADLNSWFLEKYTQDCQGTDVQDTDELKEAYRLVYQEYSARRLCLPNEAGMFYNAYSFVPGSRTFNLRKDRKFLGTVCMVADSPLGLPMETIFPNELSELRMEGRKLVEIGALSLNSKHIDMKQYSFKNFKKQAYLYKLYKTMFDYVRSIGVTDLVIGCHPRHEFLYKYITFETLSPARDYQGANSAPAVLMRLDINRFLRLTRLLKEGPGMYFFKTTHYPKPFNPDFQLPGAFVREILKSSPYWATFLPKQQDYLTGIHALT